MKTLEIRNIIPSRRYSRNSSRNSRSYRISLQATGMRRRTGDQ